MEENSPMLQRKLEILLEMQAKKFDAELSSLKQHIVSLNNEISSLKGQVSRMQFSPQQNIPQQAQRAAVEVQYPSQEAPKKRVEIIDCRPDNERKGEFVSGSAKNTEPIRPRYGDYTSQDVSIDKFFYYGNKR